MMLSMRTTITLESDVEALLKRQMRERGISFKQAVNDAIRKGLAPPRRKKFRTPTFDMGPFEIPGHKVLQLAGELEDHEILRKMGIRYPDHPEGSSSGTG